MGNSVSMEHDIAIDIDSQSPTLEEGLAAAEVDLHRFPQHKNNQDIEDALEAANLPRGSLLATLLRKTDGLLADEAWIRLFGITDRACGRTLAAWNGPEGWRDAWGEGSKGYLAFADDPFGNQFAINMGEDGTKNWHIHLGDPMTRKWKSLEVTFGQWLDAVTLGKHRSWYSEETLALSRKLREAIPVTPAQCWFRESELGDIVPVPAMKVLRDKGFSF